MNKKDDEKDPMDLSFDTLIKTDKGGYQMTLSMNLEQVKYLVEVGFRTLLTMGVITIPSVTHIPDQEEADILHGKMADDWKSKLN